MLNLKKYEDKIDKSAYLDDLIRILVSFAIKQAGTQQFVNSTEGFLLNELDTLDPKMVENVIFFFSRLGSPKNMLIVSSLIKKVQDEKLVE